MSLARTYINVFLLFSHLYTDAFTMIVFLPLAASSDISAHTYMQCLEKVFPSYNPSQKK